MRSQLDDTQRRLRTAEKRLEAAHSRLDRATGQPDGDPQTLLVTALAVSAGSALLWIINVVYLIRCSRWSRRVRRELPGMVAVEVDRKLAEGPRPIVRQADVIGTAPTTPSPLTPLWSTVKAPGTSISAAASAARLPQRGLDDSPGNADARGAGQTHQRHVLADAVKKSRAPAPDTSPATADMGDAGDQWDDNGAPAPAAAPARERTLRPQENGQPDRYVFYAQTPDVNGSFPASTLSRQPDAWTLFEIQGGGPVVAGARAVLRISDELKAQASAIASHRQFLMPVCDYGGVIPSANARRINLLKLGHVEFDGERWTVQVKARIEFLE